MVDLCLSFILTIILICQCGDSEQANILYFSTCPSPSHSLWDLIIAKALWHKGHNITFVSLTDIDKSTDNFTYIYLEGIIKRIHDKYLGAAMDASTISTILISQLAMKEACELSLQTEGTKFLFRQIEQNITYDLIMQDMTSGHCLFGFYQRFNSPSLIGTSPFVLYLKYEEMMALDMNPAYVPITFTEFTDRMSFFQRVPNFIYTYGLIIVYRILGTPMNWHVAKKVFGDDVPPLDETFRNISVMLVNHNPVWDYPVRLPPAVIPVGGLTLTKKPNISEDLLEVMNNAEHGVILASFGTNVQVDKDQSKLKAIVAAFGELKQTVLWKHHSDIENISKNVIIRKWLPQNGILAHPNLKLFISHGGGFSLQEAAYFKVPVIGIPFHADHKYFVTKIAARKYGIKLLPSMLTKESLLQNIKEILSNPVYKNNLEVLSRQMIETPEQALDRAVFWVEYILRNGGGHHLRLSLVEMGFIQSHSLDVLAFLLTVILIFILIIRKTLSSMRRSNVKSKTL